MITFITSIDFSESARYLDHTRLWKQILEASQLLERLQLIRHLAVLFDMPIPDPFNASIIYKFIREVTKPLKKKNQTPIWSNEERTQLEWKPRLPGDKNIPRYENRVKLGHIYHTIVPLWFGYENVLKYYIWVHYQEFIYRGGYTRMIFDKVETPTIDQYPPWVHIMVPYHQRILKTKRPDSYQQWAHLKDLDSSGLPWNELYMA